MNKEKQPKLYVLVGVPGSGKSTWIENQPWAKDYVIVSTDYWVEREAKERGLTYTDIFEEYMPTAVQLMIREVEICWEKNRNVIWDQTSTTIASRKKKIRMLSNHCKIAVVFRTPAMAELMNRLNNRPGKVVPHDVVVKMIKEWEEPTKEEGFDQIWYA
jgi:predicted kinase